MKLRLSIRFPRSATVAFGVALAALSVAGLGSQAVGLSSKPKPIALTNEQIPSALLALDDFPTGWSTAPLPEGANTVSATAGICNGPTALARAQGARVVGYGAIRFTSNPNQGPFVDELLYSFPSERRAKAFVKATSNQASACTTPWQLPPVSGLPMGASARATIAGLSFPKLVGDQVVAARETFTEQLNGEDISTVTEDEVLLRKGNHALVVGYLATSPDVNQLQTYVRKAYSKFGAALQNARKHTSKKAS
jgi:hypothetical protein